MTALADVTPPASIGEVPRMVSGHRMMARVSRRMIGAVLVLTAVGLWVAPGASSDPDLVLIKLGLSMFVGFAGLAVLSGEHVVTPVRVEIDTVRREIRLVRGAGQAHELVSRTMVRDLEKAEMDGMMVRLWDAEGGLLAEVALSDPAVRSGLMAVLRDEGKLK
ncbi:MAG: hypothetical protein ABJF86_10105 [Tateyamaria sp.]|uniref:hypothetical protein n=1 Tax=Tateyamaria sp. TaxID=1929288 RepID=UPI00326F3004